MATQASAIIAGAMAKARRQVIAHFQSRGAVSADTAVAFEPDRHMQRRELDRLIAAGALRTTDDGRFFIDAAALDRHQRARRQRETVAVIVVVGMVAVAAALSAIG